MLQLKRIFLFIPLSILFPVVGVALLVLVFEMFKVPVPDVMFITTSYLVSSILTFVVFWWFASGLNSKPYQHAIILLICSCLISTVLSTLVMGELYLSTTFAFDTFISCVVVFVATKVGFKNKEILKNVS
ncbi:hypothetical protein [Alteromonas sp. 009811495]|uniref:hypothetical protein n=1 Tax=Alteromonas sp. 009811495 TaxID=3002962 RepID=UPI00237EC74D|nr:hypothetical protein [Alteromonas sp. 009811495]WDT87871.1 hypothetical protein OZ660_09100 [Alteromonas sp. 009811495]